MAPFLVPGQPLKEIDLYYTVTPWSSDFLPENVSEIPPADGLALFHLVQQSTVPIEVLRIPAHVYLASAYSFSDAFPHLNELTLRFPEINHETSISSDTVSDHTAVLPFVFDHPTSLTSSENTSL